MKRYLLTFLLLGFVLLPLRGNAAGIRVTPVIQEMSLSAQQQEVIYTVLYKNSSDQTQELSLRAVDFGTLDETGGVAFIGSEYSNISTSYGLTTWIELGSDSVIIPPQETRPVRIRVINKDSLAPGGHYAALIATVKQDAPNGEATRVQVNQKIASLLFLTKTGGERYGLKLAAWDSNFNIYRVADKVSLRFYNEGNTHTVPRGYVEVIDPLGRLVKKGLINEASSYVLPETNRSMGVALKEASKTILPGKYTTRIAYRYDGKDTFATVESSRLVIPPVSLALGAILLIIVAIIFYGIRRTVRIFRKHRTQNRR